MRRHHSIPQRETLTVRRSWPDPKPCGNAGYSRARRFPRYPHYAAARPNVCGGKEFCRIRGDGIRPQRRPGTPSQRRNNPPEILIKLPIRSSGGAKLRGKEYEVAISSLNITPCFAQTDSDLRSSPKSFTGFLMHAFFLHATLCRRSDYQIAKRPKSIELCRHPEEEIRELKFTRFQRSVGVISSNAIRKYAMP